MEACNSTGHSKSGVESAMQKYDHYILNLDADSISLLFTPDGSLGDMATGRDSIKRFLSSFKNVKVLSQSSTTKNIETIKDTAIQTGTYTQSDVVSGKDTVDVKGEFTARWQWMNNDWYIKKMITRSL